MRVSVRTGPVRWDGLLTLLVWVLWRALVGVGRVLLSAVCRPRRTAAWVVLAAAGWAAVTHPVASALVAVGVGEVAAAWSVLEPVTWRRRAALPALGVWRRAVVYRRGWEAAVRAAELDRDGALPTLGRVRCLDDVDVVQVRGLLGQRFGEWEDRAPMLAHAFGAAGVVVRRGDDRRLTLELRRQRRGRSWDRDPMPYGVA